MTEGDEPKKKNEWWEWLKAILIALAIGFLIQQFVIATSVVEGESMDPTLQNGERVVFNKFVYLIDEPERGDIVIIEHPDKNYVKRVLGLPGETIEVDDHTLYIDDQAIDQTFIDQEPINSTGDFGPIHIPEDSYFVMGDNRAKSRDSRNGLGLIKEDDIIGRSELIYFPFDEWGLTR